MHSGQITGEHNANFVGKDFIAFVVNNTTTIAVTTSTAGTRLTRGQATFPIVITTTSAGDSSYVFVAGRTGTITRTRQGPMRRSHTGTIATRDGRIQRRPEGRIARPTTGSTV